MKIGILRNKQIFPQKTSLGIGSNSIGKEINHIGQDISSIISENTSIYNKNGKQNLIKLNISQVKKIENSLKFDIKNKDKLNIKYKELDISLQLGKKIDEIKKNEILNTYEKETGKTKFGFFSEKILNEINNSKKNEKILIKVNENDIINNSIYELLNNLDENKKNKIIIEFKGIEEFSRKDHKIYLFFINKIKELEKNGINIAFDTILNRRISTEEILETLNFIINGEINENENEKIDENGKKYQINKYQINTILKFKNKFKTLLINYKNFHINKTKDETKIKFNNKIDNIQELFNILDSKIDYHLKYEIIADKKGKTYYKEALLRVNQELEKKFGIKHFDILDIYNYFGKSFEILEKNINILSNDIKKGTLNGIISINTEISDIENKNLIQILKKHPEIIKNGLIFEILENQKIPNNEKFKNKIKEIKEIGIKIAFDDVLSKVLPIKETLKRIEKIGSDNLDIIKIDGKIIGDLYHMERLFGDLIDPILEKIKEALNTYSNKNIKIVAEFIDSEEKEKFVQEKLGIYHFQGYYIQDKYYENNYDKIAI